MHVQLGTWYNWPYDQTVLSHASLDYEPFDYLEFVSQSNRFLKGGGWNGGGPFISKKKFLRYLPTDPIYIDPFNKIMYKGSLYAIAPSAPPDLVPSSLGSYGPSAYRRAAPDRPVMDLPNALFELKDVPGMLKQAFNAVRNVPKFEPVRLRDVSDFNLAVAFGWLPLLDDCLKLYNSQKKIKSSLEQLKRDNGRPVRRRFQISDDSKSDVLMEGPSNLGNELRPNFITQAYASGGHWSMTYNVKESIWFSGRFRYFLPDKGQQSDDQWNSQLKRRLFGFKPTPYRIYKAMPWSWLIDWFGNVGDNISNLEASVADRLINDYAFLMRHIEQFNRMEVRQNFHSGDSIVAVRAVTDVGTDFKERLPASPFGFGLKIPDLSPFQMTILGSLAGARKRF